ncbi:MAG TPA: hypothetical protein V6D06_14380 [Trichocoleus sp.]
MINVCSALLTADEVAKAQAEGRFTSPGEHLNFGYVAMEDEIAIDRLAQHAHFAFGNVPNPQTLQAEPAAYWLTLPPRIREAWRNAVRDVIFSLGIIDGIPQAPAPDLGGLWSGNRTFVPSGFIPSKWS